MNAKDQAAMNEVIAQMKEAFAAELKSALLPIVTELEELKQRSSNFASRVNAHNAAYRAEITHLRDRLERIEPKPAAPVEPRLSDAEWTAACDALKAESKDGQTFFAPSLVRAKAKAMVAKPEPQIPPPVYDAPEAEYDF